MTRHLFGIAILSVATLAGCGRESTTPTAEAQRASAEAIDQAAVATKTAADAKIAAERRAASETKAAADAKIAADLKAAASAKEAADTKAAADLKAVEDAREAELAAAKAADDANEAKATSLLTQLTAYIKDNKTELAEKTLSQLDDMKGSLPESLQGKIETARIALNTKKAAAAF
jgi:hypothetical protein